MSAPRQLHQRVSALTCRGLQCRLLSLSGPAVAGLQNVLPFFDVWFLRSIFRDHLPIRYGAGQSVRVAHGHTNVAVLCARGVFATGRMHGSFGFQRSTQHNVRSYNGNQPPI